MDTEYTATGRPFVHYHAAHCESGVTSSFIRDKGVDVSEPMAFGIGSGIFFGHLPFIKQAGMTISTFRSQPGAIFRKVTKRLGGHFVAKTYRDPKKGMDELRQILKTGQVVALKTNLYWLTYFSERLRFNFSGHHLIVIRETENGFRISDPSLEHPVDCPAADLERARFAHGPMAPHGYMYYLTSVNPHPDLLAACVKGMKDSCNLMLKIPLPVFGVRGIRFLARKIIKSPDKTNFKEACRLLADVVRWLEDTGTGGAGFRYMYAAFLQEAAERFGSAELANLAEEMTAVGNNWREFAVVSSRIIKHRGKEEATFAQAGQLVLNCADSEEAFFKNLQKVVRKLKT